MESNEAPSPLHDDASAANDGPSVTTPARGCPANRAFIERGFRLYYSKMLGTAYNTLGLGHPDAVDILNDAAVQLLQRPDPIVLDKPKEEPVFFCRVVENLARNRIRSNAVRERDDDTTDQMIRDGLNLQPRVLSFSDPGDAMVVEHVLSLLPDAERELLQQICIVGRTPSEVARATRQSQQAVHYRYLRALDAAKAVAARLPQPIREGASNSLLRFCNSPPLNTLNGRKARQNKPDANQENEVMSTDPQNVQPGDAVGTPPVDGTSSAPITGSAASQGAIAGLPGTLPEDPVASLFDAAAAQVTAAAQSLGSNLVNVAPGATPRTNRPRAEVEQGVLAMAAVLTQFPTIAAALSPTTMVARVAQMQAGDRLLLVLKNVTTQVEDTVQVIQSGVWKDARNGYHNASRTAQESKPVAAAITTLVEIFAVAPRETTAVAHAAADTLAATNATARASKLTTKATATRQRAQTVAPGAMNALQDGTGDATITQPAPSAPAPSTTALAAAPGTPGSTKIR